MVKAVYRGLVGLFFGCLFTIFDARAGMASDAGTPAETLGLEEIVVTAQRREETLQKTSLALQVVSGSDLRKSGVVGIQDLQTVVPGLVIGSAGATAQVYIRGVGDFGSTPITNPAVSLNIDGIYVALTQAVQGGFFDIARVEVLKGPQGTLYGRNASGGAINIIPNLPSVDAVGGYAEVQGGNLGFSSEEAALNLPINSQLAVRIAAQSVSRDGYLSNGSDDDHHQSVRLQGLWKTDESSLLLAVDYTHAGGEGGGYAVAEGNSQGLSPWTAGSDPRLANSFYAIGALQGLCVPAAYFPAVHDTRACPTAAPYPPPFPPGFLGPYTSLATFEDGAQSQDNTYYRYHGEFKRELGDVTLTVLPAYQTASLEYNVFPGGFEYATPEKEHATSVEARLSQSISTLKWVAGLYYFDEHQHSEERIDAGLIQDNAPVTDLFTRSDAVFGELNWSVLDHTRLIAGARYTKDTKGIDGSVTAIPPSIAQLPPIPSNPCFAALPGNCLLESYSGNTNFDKFTWKLGVEQDLTAESMLFATASTGFKAGGFDQSAIAVPGSHEAESFQPETLTAFELGSRNRFFDDRLQANLEAFYWKYKNHQEPFVTIDGQGQIAFDYQNAGNAHLYGFDLDLVFKATNADILRTTVELLHSRFDSFDYSTPANPEGIPFVRGEGNGYTSTNPMSPLGQSTGCATAPITSGIDAGGVHVNCSGYPLTHAPEWSGTVGYTHTFALPSSDVITASVNGRYATRQWIAADFVAAENAPGYFTENAVVSYISRNHWSVSIFGRNLSDRAIYTGAFESPYINQVTSSIEPPRTYGGRVNVEF